MSIGISGCSRDPKPEMLARAAALGRALAPRGAVVAGRRQLMVASPNLLQEAAAKAASDPHVNCFKMATDGADPVMCAPLRAAGAADASSACLLRPGRPCTIALDSMRRLLLRCCRVRPCPFGVGGGGGALSACTWRLGGAGWRFCPGSASVCDGRGSACHVSAALDRALATEQFCARGECTDCLGTCCPARVLDVAGRIVIGTLGCCLCGGVGIH